MARNISNLRILSSIVQKLITTLNNPVQSIRLLRSFHHKKIWDRGDGTQLQLPMLKLRDSSTQIEITQLVNENSKNIDGHDAVRALTRLFRLNKRKSGDHSSVITTKEFLKLCEILKANIRQLSDGEAIQSLKVLNYFHVPTSTVIIQMLLQIIRNSVNNLSLEQMLFLNFLLPKCQKTPLGEALLIALPIVFRSQIKQQLDNKNIDTLVELLRYSLQVHQKYDSVSIILNALNNVDESLITLNHAKILLMSMSDLAIDNATRKLVKKCQQVLINSIDNIYSSDLTRIVHKTVEACKTSHGVMYNEGLLDACAMTVISRDMGFKVAVDTLAGLNKVTHTNNSLLDYIAAKCFENKNMNNIIDSMTSKILIYGLSNADYKPVFWESLKNVLLNEKLLRNPPPVLISISIHLATLDCYWPQLLKKIYTMNCRSMQFTPNLRSKFLLLYNLVKTNYPEYNGPWPSDELIEMCDAMPLDYQPNSPLKSALECTLGGPQYCLTNVKSTLGYNIDHVVIMRKGGFPIAVNNLPAPALSRIEDLKSSQDSQVILFKNVPIYGCARNTQRLIGFWSLLIRTLKSQPNYTVIPIYNHMWLNLTESEQLQYISQAIRLNCDELSAVINS